MSVLVAIVGALTVLPASVTAASSATLSTTVEPQAGYNFLYAAVHAAKHSIDMSMYELNDNTFDSDLAARAHAGVRVRVLLDSDYGIKNYNTPAATYLLHHGVHVTWAPSNQIFHAKYLIIDDAILYVGTGNLTAEYYSSTRDFWITDRSDGDVKEAAARFESDFTKKFVTQPPRTADLVWSPGSTEALLGVINGAHHTLAVENEEMNSSTIESALIAAAHRHVHVEVVMTYNSQYTSALTKLAKAGVSVRTLSSDQVYIHAKVLCADCTATAGTVFVGSQNFSTSSLVYNRELGVLTTSLTVVKPVRAAVAADYAAGTTKL